MAGHEASLSNHVLTEHRVRCGVPIFDKNGFDIVGYRAGYLYSVIGGGVINWRGKRGAAIERHH